MWAISRSKSVRNHVTLTRTGVLEEVIDVIGGGKGNSSQ